LLGSVFLHRVFKGQLPFLRFFAIHDFRLIQFDPRPRGINLPLLNQVVFVLGSAFEKDGFFNRGITMEVATTAATRKGGRCEVNCGDESE